MEERISELLYSREGSAGPPEHLFTNLEMFPGVFQKINRTSTAFGRVCLKEILRNPLSDKVVLEERQSVIKEIIQKGFRDVVAPLGGMEVGPLELWDDLDEEGESVLELVYFSLPLGETCNTFLNSREDILQVNTYYNIYGAPILTALGPVLSILIPLIILKVTNRALPVGGLIKLAVKLIFRWDMLMALPLKARLTTILGMLAWFAFYLYSIFTAVASAKHIHSTVNIFHRRITAVARFCQKVEEIYRRTESVLPFGDQALEESLAYYRGLFANPCLLEEPRLFNNKGAILCTYRRMHATRDLLLPIFAYVANLDAFCSIARLGVGPQRGGGGGFSYPKYLESGAVELKAVGLWHPILGTGSQRNSVRIKRNLIVTGPNAAGKSTFIKSVALAVLLGQTIGLVPAKRFSFTPFARINTYANIADTEGVNSLFQAEMRRCKAHLDLIKDGEKTFMIIDEMFSSTNYNEGLAGALAICRRLISYENSMSLVTTHYTPLASALAEDEEGIIEAVRFNAEKMEDGSIRFPYKLEKGVSDQYIALDLLRLEGYDADIIADAVDISGRVRLELVD